MDRGREGRRHDRYAYRTVQAHRHWIRGDLHDCGGKRHPNQPRPKVMERFLSHFAPKDKAADLLPSAYFRKEWTRIRQSCRTNVRRCVGRGYRVSHRRKG